MKDKLWVLLCMIIVFGLGAGTMYFIGNKYLNKPEKTTKEIVEKRDVTITDNTGISEAVDKVYNTVVMIKTYRNGRIYGSGSGVIYKIDDKFGYIMTNYHVVDESTSIKVRFYNEEELDGKVMGGDKWLDIAIVRVDKKDYLKKAEIGSSDKLKMGDTVFAVGTPVGEEYYNTITRGIVSGIDRKVTLSVETKEDWVMKAIQVDAAINPGNSGGPLFNASGEVVGINSVKLIDSKIEGMGFSIKIEDAMEYATTFENGKEIERPLLGIRLVNTSNYDYGVEVISIEKNSGAEKSDLKAGDIIIKIGKEKIINQAYLKYVLYSYKVGDKIEVTYLRGGKEQKTEVTLTKNNG
ncbi:MAG: trypsin-like peptidase domain-containing protein [Bacilli bacterium]|nr:trypsin-like peptidase domain-containing protein [Bacilli bacterium]